MKWLKAMLAGDRGWLFFALPCLVLVKIFDFFFLSYIGNYFGFEAHQFFLLISQETFISLAVGALVLFGDMLLISFFDKWFPNNLFALRLLPTFRTLIKIVALLIWLYFSFQTFGINVSGLWTGAGLSGAVLAFIGKDALANVFGGLTLLFSQKFQIGDTIRVKLMEGKIEKMTVSETTLISKQGHTIFIPNKLLLSEVIENLSMQKEKVVSADFLIDKEKYASVQDFLNAFEKFTKKEADLASLELVPRLVSTDSKDVRVFVEGNVPAETDVVAVRQKIMLFALDC